MIHSVVVVVVVAMTPPHNANHDQHARGSDISGAGRACTLARTASPVKESLPVSIIPAQVRNRLSVPNKDKDSFIVIAYAKHTQQDSGTLPETELR